MKRNQVGGTVTANGFMFAIYELYIAIHHKEKWTKAMNRPFTEEETSLVIREMQVKSTMSDKKQQHKIPLESTRLKK